MIKVLGIDPGLAFTGFGLVKNNGSHFMHIEHGTITTKKDMEHSKRLLTIYNGIGTLVEKHKPNFAGIESLYFAKNVSSGLLVSQALGVILLALEQHHIPVYEFAPNMIKKTVTGIALADKIQVQHCVKIMLALPDLPKPDHAADALAAAITALTARPRENFMPPNNERTYDV